MGQDEEVVVIQTPSMLRRLGGLAKRISQNGSENEASRLLDEVFRLHREEKLTENSFYTILEALLETAESRHAARVAEMLTWNITVASPRRRTRIALMALFIRVGTRKHIPCLQAFAEFVKQILYPDETWKPLSAGPIAASPEFFQQLDQADIRAAIAACEAREDIPDH